MNESLDSVKEMLGELKRDNSIPRNIRSKIEDVLTEISKDDCKFDIKVSRLLNNLEDISDDPNLPSYIRTEILTTIGILSEI